MEEEGLRADNKNDYYYVGAYIIKGARVVVVPPWRRPSLQRYAPSKKLALLSWSLWVSVHLHAVLININRVHQRKRVCV